MKFLYFEDKITETKYYEAQLDTFCLGETFDDQLIYAVIKERNVIIEAKGNGEIDDKDINKYIERHILPFFNEIYNDLAFHKIDKFNEGLFLVLEKQQKRKKVKCLK